MAKVHPNAAVAAELATPTTNRAAADQEPEPPTVLTVWRKSLLFNCDGFTVYDANGGLAFRVDCYAAPRRRAEVVLMDAAGAPLLTVRRKRLSLAERWLIYDGADADAAASSSRPPLLSIRRHVGGLQSSGGKTLAHVVTPNATPTSEAFVVEGSYGRRACAVRDARGDVVAEVRRKEAVGDDVFRLVVSPRLGAPLAMGLVIALDEMFGGRGSARSWLRGPC
ncbi:unnamed protein product [Miscanthus lutarioriparius]|uniref:Protein LURP-one-related 8 n=1 Tax=Miscanthus lutarioriparius TaxID=422564 RepID=A0A811RF20_9POAL|nr:unnamed protein product [Miscanthus lutarioriparius]CAD6268662.1 unnamed protein product [Miscanthus lutarioriparius]